MLLTNEIDQLDLDESNLVFQLGTLPTDQEPAILEMMIELMLTKGQLISQMLLGLVGLLPRGDSTEFALRILFYSERFTEPPQSPLSLTWELNPQLTHPPTHPDSCRVHSSGVQSGILS